MRQDAGLSSKHYAFSDAGVLRDAHLPCQNDILLDDNAAGKPTLCGDHNVFPDLAVVADVHQIVDFHAPADASYIEGSAIDGGVADSAKPWRPANRRPRRPTSPG